MIPARGPQTVFLGNLWWGNLWRSGDLGLGIWGSGNLGIWGSGDLGIWGSGKVGQAGQVGQVA